MSVTQIDTPAGVPREFKGHSLKHLWPYVDGKGQAFGYVARYDDTEGGKSVIPYFRSNGTGWKASAETAPRRLFGLNTLKGDRVFVVEGEKCAAALHGLGLAAVTSPCGSNSAHNADWAPLTTFSEIIILPDNDDAGLEYARSVARIVNGLPGPRKVRVCELPGLPEKGDVVDWLQSQVSGWDGFTPIPREPGDDLLDDFIEEVTSHSRPVPPDWLEDDVWPRPIPLRPVAPPEWPRGVFPADIEAFVAALSTATETPMELAGSVVLGGLATSLHGKYIVRVKADYFEPLCLWTCCALPSGSRKSAVLSKAMAPLIAWEKAERERLEPVIKELLSERRTIQSRIDGLRRQTAKPECKDLPRITKEIAELEKSLPLIPVIPRLWTSDITPEHLGTLMDMNQERMGVLCDEAGILEIINGRYSKNGPNLDLFLQGHAATAVRVDRGSRPPVTLDRPVLSVVLMPQPDVIRSLSNSPEFRGRGLLARFLYTMPEHNLGTRTGETPPVPLDVSQGYNTIVNALLKRKGEEEGDGREKAYVLNLAPDAYKMWRQFWREIEDEMADGGLLEHLRDWGGKLPGAVARIAGIFHVTRHAFQNERNHLVSADDMDAAIKLGRFFCEHALIAFDEMGADRARDDARSILGWVRREERKCFSKRDVHRALQGTFKKSEEIDEPLAILVDRHYIRKINEAKKPTGRPQGEKYEANPHAFEVSEKA